MKKYFILFATALFALFACNQYDDGPIKERLDNLEARIEALEALQTQVNDLATLVMALENKDYVTGVTPIMEGGVQVGYSIMFTQSDPIEIRNGKDGKDGKDGVDGAQGAAGADGTVVSIKKDTDGIFYWTLDGQFTDPKLRVDGVTPQFKIDEDAYLCVSYDGGTTWEQLGKTGASVESNMKVTYDDDYVTFTFTDTGDVINLPREKKFTLSIASPSVVAVEAGNTVKIPYVLTNSDDTVLMETIAEGGYKAKVTKTDNATGTIDVIVPNPAVDGKVIVLANKEDKTCMKTLYFEEGVFTLVTNTLAASPDGEKVAVNFSTNYQYEVEIPADAPWITLGETKAPVADSVYLYVMFNEGEARSAIVKFNDLSGNMLAQYTITQEASATKKIRALFGIQPTQENPYGFTNGANRTMAVIGNYLILSNSADYTNMPVYDRMTGDYLPSVKVNTTGIDAGRSIMAISNDDAGHLIAVAFTNLADEATNNNSVRGWIWLNGIDQAPKSFMWAALDGGKYANAPYGVNGAQKIDIYRTVKVRGDLAGDAIIATCSKQVPRPVFEFVVGGKLVGNAYIEWPSGSHPVSMWNSTAVVPLTGIATEGDTPEDRVVNTKAKLEYVWSSGNFRKALVYSKAKAGVWFTQPTSHWWGGGINDYGQVTWGVDVIEANGTRLMAVQNGNAAGGGQFYTRLYVSNIGMATPTADTFKDGFLFDSRQGDASGTDNIPGSGFAVTGMTSPHAFVTGTTVLGTNGNETGDVKFALGADGASVQVYMLTTNQGLLGYNIPFSKF